ncbi:CD320 antigen isoform X1 [Phasianus colchicus]|uniref:CD320 antigen isoform X1 n=1 Tax=Phasianus colchicus TaxID=9054 RepID=UPI00129E851C|nr:CD320 antigen isoform X1 [Phasianus colchicus]
MARLQAVLVVLLRAVRLLPGSASGNGSLARCPPEQFHCSELHDPQTDCYPLEWLCDGHPDCDDGRDEWGCGTNGSTALPTAGGTEASAVPAPGHALPSRNHGRMWMLIVAVLLSCLVAVGGIAAWGKSKAKSRSDIFSLENASREQLVPDKSQADLFSCQGSFTVRW